MRYYLLVIGIALIAFGAKLFIRQLLFVLRSVRTEGRIEGWEESPQIGDRSQTYFYAEIVFTDRDGTERRCRGNLGLDWKPKGRVGRPVPVRYNPENPEEAQMGNAVNLWAAPLAFFVMAAAAFFAFLHPQP